MESVVVTVATSQAVPLSAIASPLRAIVTDSPSATLTVMTWVVPSKAQEAAPAGAASPTAARARPAVATRHLAPVRIGDTIPARDARVPLPGRLRRPLPPAAALAPWLFPNPPPP